MSGTRLHAIANCFGIAIVALHGFAAISCVNRASSRTSAAFGPGVKPESEFGAHSTSNHPIAPDVTSEKSIDTILDDDLNDDFDESERRDSRANQPHPFDAYSGASLREAFEKHPEALGSISIGKPNAGRLMNGIKPQESPLYHLVDPNHAWGTTETVQAVCHAIDVVARLHEGTRAIDIGHISAKDGGPLRPHHSHQSGRDVDLGLYYHQVGTRWYTHATQESLDVPRTWTLIRTLVTDTDIELILLDRNLQEVIEKYAVSFERDSNWVQSLFRGDGARRALIRHSPGHATHMHLRFFNPVACESARLLSPFLNLHQWVPASVTNVIHVAASGDTLAKLAQRYHTTIAAIRRANRMQSYQLVAGRRYTIPLPDSSTTREPAASTPRRNAQGHPPQRPLSSNTVLPSP